jgi:ATP-dependent DNA helicase DinG
VIIANHALFFTDLAMRSLDTAGALLPDYGAALIDEAHTLENNAAEYLGLHLSRQGVTGELNRLFNPDNSRGLLMRSGTDISELRAAVAEARDEAYGFFQPYENFLAEKHESALRISAPERFPDRLTPALLKLCSRLGKFVEDEEDPGFKTELSSHLARCSSFIDAVDQFNHQTLPDAVYYIESERGGVTLHAAPLNVGELL